MQLLFVCTGNTCRSPMASAYAAAVLHRCGREDIVVRSAGLAAWAGSPASDGAIAVMEQNGIDLTGFRSTRVSAPLLDGSDRIICMTGSHRRAVAELLPDGTDRIMTLLPGGADVPDPFGGPVAAYEAVWQVMRPALDQMLNQLAGENKNE